MVDVPITALAAGGLSIGAISALLASRIQGNLNYDQDRARMLHLGIYVAGAMLWPVVAQAALASCGFKSKPSGGTPVIMTAAMTIPVLYLLINGMLSPYRHREGRRRHEDVRVGGSLIASVVFTAAMLGNASKVGKAAALETSACKTRLLGIALVMSVLFVLVTPDVDRTSWNGTLLTTMQNIILTYAVGLFGVAYAL